MIKGTTEDRGRYRGKRSSRRFSDWLSFEILRNAQHCKDRHRNPQLGLRIEFFRRLAQNIEVRVDVSVGRHGTSIKMDNETIGKETHRMLLDFGT